MTVKTILKTMDPEAMVQLRNGSADIYGSAGDLLNVVDERMLNGRAVRMEAGIRSIPHHSWIGFTNIYWEGGVL